MVAPMGTPLRRLLASEHVVGSLLVGGGNLSYGYHKSISDVKSIIFDKDRENFGNRNNRRVDEYG